MQVGSLAGSELLNDNPATQNDIRHLVEEALRTHYLVPGEASVLYLFVGPELIEFLLQLEYITY